MNALIALFVALTAVTGAPGESAAGPQDQAGATSEYSFDSAVLAEPVTLNVALPTMYESTKHAYPLVLVLDGESHFKHVAESARYLQSFGGMPESIVVGIKIVSRSRFFTTPPAEGQQVPSFIENPGSADEFLKFLRSELIPDLERRYRVTPLRVLVGHSLGGLLTAYGMLTQPDLCYGYVVLDGSLFWNDGEIPKLAAERLPELVGKKIRLFNGHSGPPGSEEKPFPPFAQQWYKAIEDKAPETFSSESGRFPGYSHNLMAPPAAYAGLKSVFKEFSLMFKPKMTAEQFFAHFAKQSENYGYQIVPSEYMIRNFAFILVFEKRPDEALAFLDQVAGVYPKSYAVPFYRGQAYELKEEWAKARQEYLQALDLDPDNAVIKRELAKLPKN